MEGVIHCPKCGAPFEPSALVREQIETELRTSMKAEFERRLHAVDASARANLKARELELAAARAELGEARGKEATLLKEQRELIDQRAEMNLDVERRVAEEARRIRDREAKIIQERCAREAEERLRQKDEELAEAHAKIGIAASKEANLLRQKRELEEREQRLTLDVERRLADETTRIRAEESKHAEERFSLELEQQHLREEEQRQKSDDLKKTIAELQRRIQQGSQQSQGEAQEVILRELLTEAFETDEIEDVAKGVSGADVLQRVRSSDGRDCGTIVWESKRRKTWSDGWLPKLRDDQRAAGAACAILVTQELPKGMRHFGLQDGVWVSAWTYAVALGAVLRRSLIDVALAKRMVEGRGEKKQLLYEYLTGTEFCNRVGGLVEAFTEMQDDLEREKRAMLTTWKRREKQMQRARDNITAFYGDMQGIVGQKLEDLPALALEPGLRDPPLLELGTHEVDREATVPSSRGHASAVKGKGNREPNGPEAVDDAMDESGAGGGQKTTPEGSAGSVRRLAKDCPGLRGAARSGSRKGGQNESGSPAWLFPRPDES